MRKRAILAISTAQRYWGATSGRAIATGHKRTLIL